MKYLLVSLMGLLVASAGCSERTSSVGNISDQAVPVKSLESRLDKTATLMSSGNVRYRAPSPGRTGPVVVLFHALYGGASHLAWRQVLPLLDDAGARVYLMDVLGTGESSKPRRMYTSAELETFVVEFLDQVVNEPAIVVGQSTSTMSVLGAAAKRPDLVQKVVLLSPTGIHLLSAPPSAEQDMLFQSIYNDDAIGSDFWNMLLSDESVESSVVPSYYDPSLVTETDLNEYKLQRKNLEQRWITFAFVGGRTWKPFTEASIGLSVPLHLVFGREDKPIEADAIVGAGQMDRPEDFPSLVPHAKMTIIDESGGLVWREKPAKVVQAILE